ncbi:MAG: DUF4123 domain-containing protein [Pseudomonadota bacterium]
MSAPSSLPQQKATLWTQPDAHVYAVIDASQVPGLTERLAHADIQGWDCLHRGALPPDDAAKAPYLVELKPESPFTDWLLQEASATMEHWGVLVISALGLRAMREHLRDLNDAQTPQGQRFVLRWYDRRILRVLLPSLSPAQLQPFFGPITAIAVPAGKDWTWFRESVGQLMTDTRTIAG